MSYDLGLVDKDGGWYQLMENHQMRGGTYCIGGSPTAEINITYNYSKHFWKVLPAVPSESRYAVDGMLGGIRRMYGMTGAESIPLLVAAIDGLGDDVSHDYWESTEGNAKAALKQCLALARMCPDGVWEGD